MSVGPALSVSTVHRVSTSAHRSTACRRSSAAVSGCPGVHCPQQFTVCVDCAPRLNVRSFRFFRSPITGVSLCGGLTEAQAHIDANDRPNVSGWDKLSGDGLLARAPAVS